MTKSSKKPRSGTSKRARTVQFLQKATCTTCRKARAFLERRGFQLHFRDLDKDRLSPAELQKLIGPRDHTKFLNTRNEMYRRKKMKDKPPSRREAISLMAREPNLIRRPVVLGGGRVIVGYDEEGMAHL